MQYYFIGDSHLHRLLRPEQNPDHRYWNTACRHNRLVRAPFWVAGGGPVNHSRVDRLLGVINPDNHRVLMDVASALRDAKGIVSIGWADFDAILKNAERATNHVGTNYDLYCATSQPMQRLLDKIATLQNCLAHYNFRVKFIYVRSPAYAKSHFYQELEEMFVTRLHKRLGELNICLLYTSPSPRDKRQSRMPSSA